MKAALLRWFARWRSTQLSQALSFPPTNHFQNGGRLVSSVVCQVRSQWSRSAYSRKYSGKWSGVNRLTIDGSFKFAWAMNAADGWTYSSSFQWTAISFASFFDTVAITGSPAAMLSVLGARCLVLGRSGCLVLG